MSPLSHIKCGGVIIAGGRAARMGGAEKPFLKLSGRPIIERLVERVRPQVDALAIDVREESRDRYQAWRAIGISILSDPFRGEAGPLGGIIGGLRWLETLGSDFEWLATFPGDTPLLPRDLVTRMRASAREGAPKPVVAVDGGGVQSLCALWPRSCLTGLTGHVMEKGVRSVRAALQLFDTISCEFLSQHAFTNINTEGDLADAEQLLQMESGFR